jgi:hypothetical protein
MNCSNDDDNTPPQSTNTNTWNLTHVVGGIAGIDQTIPTGLIQWTFNNDTGMLVVVNNNTDEMLFDFFDSGIYPYNIQNNGTDDLITIDGIEFGAWIETQNEVTIDQQVNDGFLLTLTR